MIGLTQTRLDKHCQIKYKNPNRSEWGSRKARWPRPLNIADVFKDGGDANWLKKPNDRPLEKQISFFLFSIKRRG